MPGFGEVERSGLVLVEALDADIRKQLDEPGVQRPFCFLKPRLAGLRHPLLDDGLTPLPAKPLDGLANIGLRIGHALRYPKTWPAVLKLHGWYAIDVNLEERSMAARVGASTPSLKFESFTHSSHFLSNYSHFSVDSSRSLSSLAESIYKQSNH
jgi:hypothetical protein